MNRNLVTIFLVLMAMLVHSSTLAKSLPEVRHKRMSPYSHWFGKVSLTFYSTRPTAKLEFSPHRSVAGVRDFLSFKFVQFGNFVHHSSSHSSI